MENYKGVYYGENIEQHYYEGGAHFKYKDLFHILLSLYKEKNKKNITYNSKLVSKHIFNQNKFWHFTFIG